jgi:hypothetical protein
MKLKFIKAIALSLTLSVGGFVSTVNAGVITESASITDWDTNAGNLDDVTLSLDFLYAANMIGDLKFTFKAFGDFADNNQTIKLGLINGDGVVVSGPGYIWLDGTLYDGGFINVSNDGTDIGLDSLADINIATYMINNTTDRGRYSSMNDGGGLDVNFNFSNRVLSTAGNMVSVTVEYEVVPEPSTIAIFALGMIGLASRRFKKKS